MFAWRAVRSTANVVTPRAGGQRFGGEVLKNRPAMLVIAGYTFHSWELLGMWAWTPAFLAACFVAAGSDLTRGAGLGAYMTSLFHVTGMIAALMAGVLADRFGRAPVILVMATISAACSLVFGWLIGMSLVLVVGLGLLYGFAALGDSPIYSTAITEVVAPAYRGSALALRSLLGYGAGRRRPPVRGNPRLVRNQECRGVGMGLRESRYRGGGSRRVRPAPVPDPGGGGASSAPRLAPPRRLHGRAMTPETLRTRLATPADAAAIAAIYNEGIADRIATFETEPRTPEQLATQLIEKGDRFPTVVVEREGQIVAWGGAGAYRSRPAYSGVAEHSVYVARAARRTGAGREALNALCRVYAERGFWKIVSRIFPENTASLALHERCGFRVVGVYHRHGKLDGQWRDCVIVERLLDSSSPGE